MWLILIAIVDSELMLCASTIVWFVCFVILPGRPDAELEEQMQRLAAESSIDTWIILM
jgi:hypothetical protein